MSDLRYRVSCFVREEDGAVHRHVDMNGDRYLDCDTEEERDDAVQSMILDIYPTLTRVRTLRHVIGDSVVEETVITAEKGRHVEEVRDPETGEWISNEDHGKSDP